MMKVMRLSLLLIFLVSVASSFSFVTVTNSSVSIDELGLNGFIGKAGPCDHNWNIIENYPVADVGDRTVLPTLPHVVDFLVCDSRKIDIGGCSESCSATVTISGLSPNHNYSIGLSGISNSAVVHTAQDKSVILSADYYIGKRSWANSSSSLEVVADQNGDLIFTIKKEFNPGEDNAYYNYGNTVLFGWNIEDLGSVGFALKPIQFPSFESSQQVVDADQITILFLTLLLFISFIVIAFLVGFLVGKGPFKRRKR